MQQVSSVYWDVARAQFNKFFPNIPPYHNSLSQINEIERSIKIKKPMTAGIKSIQQSLKKVGVILPNQIADIIIHNDTPYKECENFREQIEAKGITEEEKGGIIFHAIAAVHRQRVRSDSVGKSFFDTEPHNRYMYLPVEMIGFRCALEDYSFIKRTTEILALRPNDYYVEEAYKLAKLDFKEKYAIFPPSLETIQRAILCLPSYVNPEIYHAFEQDSRLLHIVAQQVLRYF